MLLSEKKETTYTNKFTLVISGKFQELGSKRLFLHTLIVVYNRKQTNTQTKNTK